MNVFSKIFCLVLCLTLAMSSYGLATEGTQWESTPTRQYHHVIPISPPEAPHLKDGAWSTPPGYSNPRSWHDVWFRMNNPTERIDVELLDDEMALIQFNNDSIYHSLESEPTTYGMIFNSLIEFINWELVQNIERLKENNYESNGGRLYQRVILFQEARNYLINFTINNRESFIPGVNLTTEQQEALKNILLEAGKPLNQLSQDEPEEYHFLDSLQDFLEQLFSEDSDPSRASQVQRLDHTKRFSTDRSFPERRSKLNLPENSRYQEEISRNKNEANKEWMFSWIAELTFKDSSRSETKSWLDVGHDLYVLLQWVLQGRRSAQMDRSMNSESRFWSNFERNFFGKHSWVRDFLLALGVLDRADIPSDQPLMEEHFKKGLYLLSEALAASLETPGLSAEDAGKIIRANLLITNFLADDGAAGSKKPSALVVLADVEKMLGTGASIANVLAHSSLRQSRALVLSLTHCIVMTVKRTNMNMKERTLLDAEQFSAGEANLSRLENPKELGGSVRGEENLFQVIDSVVLSRENVRTRALLDPPHKLHPFMRWLFYGCHLTPDRVDGYLAEHAKVQEICMRAKAGEGLIRYKGMVMNMFLPLPGDESGGAFELVRRV